MYIYFFKYNFYYTHIREKKGEEKRDNKFEIKSTGCYFSYLLQNIGYEI